MATSQVVSNVSNIVQQQSENPHTGNNRIKLVQTHPEVPVASNATTPMFVGSERAIVAPFVPTSAVGNTQPAAGVGLPGQRMPIAIETALTNELRAVSDADTALSKPQTEFASLRSAEVHHGYSAQSGGFRGVERPIFVHIAQTSLATGQSTIDITLMPEELGRLRVSLSHSDGVLTVTLGAERQDTQELLRRHGEDLAREYRELGFDSVELNFADKDGGMSDREVIEDSQSESPAEENVEDPRARARHILTHTALDIRM